jgi:hypothetical protein
MTARAPRRYRWNAIALVGTTAILMGCGSRADHAIVSARVSPAGFEDLECRLALSNGARRVEYRFQPPLNHPDSGVHPDAGAARDSPTFVCDLGAPTEDCVALGSAPTATECRRSAKCINLSFYGAEVTRLTDYLGSSAFDVEVTCGTFLIFKDRGQVDYANPY